MSLGQKQIKVSEAFYSIQGEGVTAGVPCVFIRLFDCNLCCGGMKGELLESGKSSWVCDTIPVWTRFDLMTLEELEDHLRKEGEKLGVDIIQGLVDGTIHFIWTGGEPTMEHNREAIRSFIMYWNEKYPDNESFHELETNGTIFCPLDKEFQDSHLKYALCMKPFSLYDFMDQINCSAKLANSGMKVAARIVPEAIDQIKIHPNHWWKFVIDCTNEETALRDWKEIVRDYVEPFGLDKRRIVFMPGVDKLEDLPDVTRVMYEVAKKVGVRAVTRGHILAYDQTTGV